MSATANKYKKYQAPKVASVVRHQTEDTIND